MPNHKRIVIQVTLDGLATNVFRYLLGHGLLPALGRFVPKENLNGIGDGCGTLNGRTDPKITVTLPNHMGILSSRGTFHHGHQITGHRTMDNSDPHMTGHELIDSYLFTIFDQAANQGMSCKAFAGKAKFQHLDDTYTTYQDIPFMKPGMVKNLTVDPLDPIVISPELNREPLLNPRRIKYQDETRTLIVKEETGTTEEQYKTDWRQVLRLMPRDGILSGGSDAPGRRMYQEYTPLPLVKQLLENMSHELGEYHETDDQARFNGTNFYFLHLLGTDVVGHESGWDSVAYQKAVVAIDQEMGFLMDSLLKLQDEFSDFEFFLLVTSDHGGGAGTFMGIGSSFETTSNHDLPQYPVNHTVMIGLWRSGQAFKENDLYQLIQKQLQEQASQTTDPKIQHELKNLVTEPKDYNAEGLGYHAVKEEELEYDFFNLETDHPSLRGPLRNLYCGNFAASILGLEAIPDSWGGYLWTDTTDGLPMLRI